MNFAAALRSELLERARAYALSENLPHCVGYEGDPAICFEPYDDGLLHGNFDSASYKAIRRNPEWARRLGKVHTLGHRLFPRSEFGRRRELDTSTSSDALLMNIFCHPATARSKKLCGALGIEGKTNLSFGYRARVPLLEGRSDRTEVDLRFGDQLMEAKLTENDFQRVERAVSPPIVISPKYLIGGGYRRLLTITRRINYYATSWRPTLSVARSGSWSMPEGPTSWISGTRR